MQCRARIGIMSAGEIEFGHCMTVLRRRTRSAEARRGAGLSTPATRRNLRRGVARHHRRRRAIAAGTVLALAVLAVVGIMSHTGSAVVPAHPVPPAGPGFFARIRLLGGRGPASFAGSQLADENAAINRTLARTPYVRVAGRQHRELALTFDDGPGPYTPEILSILNREHVPATFFEVGIAERYFHVSTTEMVTRGYVIGDHTESHAPMAMLSAGGQQLQLMEQTQAIGRYGAPFPRLFRPPYGMFNSTTFALLRHYRMLMILWTVDTSDYTRPGVAAIIHRAVSGARPGAIILLHDAGGNRSETVAALPRIIAVLRARGYKLVTVPKLLLDNPPPANQNFSTIIGSGG
jgi:peptidoglycan-N-acetylglucosamine deacetylase